MLDVRHVEALEQGGRVVEREEEARPAAVVAAPAFLRGQNLNGRMNIAVIGTGGRGGGNLKGVSSENIVALCDVNEKNLAAAAAAHPQARREVDFRKLFDRPEAFDAVVVTAAPERIPEPLIEQLVIGGRMVIPVGRFFQNLLVITKTPDGIVQRTTIPVRFVPMTGEIQDGEKRPDR